MSSTAVARALIAYLCAAGVGDVVVAPGSRSAPLVYALAAAEEAGWLRTHVRVDERVAGFFALGLARAAWLDGSRRPVAVVTTSGTAVANLHPAVLEASHSGVPLVVVSADRPHEVRGTGANQTTSQPGLFADAVRATFDLPAGFEVDAVRGQVARLVAAALGTRTGDPGPVHLNVGLREPLVPDDRWRPGPLPIPLAVAPVPDPIPAGVAPGLRTVVVAGDGAGLEAARVADAAAWPLLAEPTSGARLEPAITHYQALLAAGLGDEAQRVVVFGHPTLSRPVARLLARPGAVVVAPGVRWTDVTGSASCVVGALEPPAPTASDHAWLARWHAADAVVEDGWAPSPVEAAARALWHQATRMGPDVLVLGSSTTIRAFDLAALPARHSLRAVANRGLAGIDGTISTAGGVAAGLGEPVRVVLGDLAFLHDVGGLARGELEPEVDLQAIVFDDGGGGIFSTLEHASADPAIFKRYFTTPPSFDVAAAARAFGARHTSVDLHDLPSALAEPVTGRSVLQIRLDPHDLPAARSARLAVARSALARRVAGTEGVRVRRAGRAR